MGHVPRGAGCRPRWSGCWRSRPVRRALRPVERLDPSSLGPIDTFAIRAHTSVLAHDSLAGRGTGTAGSSGAARYIAQQLASLGVLPLDGNARRSTDYLRAVPLLRADVSAAELHIAGAPETRLRHGVEFVVGRVGRDGLRPVRAPVARLGADSTDVARGSWLLLDASPGEAAARWVPEWRSRGVVGLVVRLGSDAAVAGWVGALGHTRWHLAEGEPDPIWQADLPIVLVAPRVADLLTQSAAVLSFEPNARTERVVDHNVAGRVIGADPARADEVVFMTAHYDHLGTVRGAGLDDSIFNGFSDNAAGVAMLLAVAAQTAAAPPARTTVFLFTTAEEVGLLGSIHFARTESVVAHAHAVVNVDAGAPPAPPTRWRLAAATRSRALDVAAPVVEAHGWTHRSDGGAPNSDHWPFVQRGVPAVFLIPDGAYEGVDEAEAQRLRERWDRYHHPDDEWAADFPFAGLARYALLARDIAWAFANEPSGR